MRTSPRQIEQLFQDLEDGNIDSQDHALLMRLLVEDAAVRHRYCEHMAFVGAMNQEAVTHAEFGGGPSRDGEPEPAGRLFASSLLAAAAILLLTALVAAFITLRQPPLMVDLQAPAGSAWSIVGEDGRAVPKGVLREGSRVEVATGLVTFTMDCGARMVIEGPAVVGFPVLHSPSLESGSLWIETAPASEPMCVTAAGWEFRDIGTRFGVRIGHDGRPVLSVTKGLVRASLIEGGVSHRVTASDHSSRFDVDGERELGSADADPFPRLTRMLGRPDHYVTAVLRQSPVGYWDFERLFSGEFLNRVRPGHPGQADQLIDVASAGPGPAEGFAGFSKANGCAVLPGNSEKSVVYELDSPEGVSLTSGSVSLWFRRAANLNHREVLWFAGSGVGGGQEIQLYLAEGGLLHLIIDDGMEEVRLETPGAVNDDRWHHVAASWSEGSVSLYLDGELAAAETSGRIRRTEPFRGIHVRVGKAGLEAVHRGEWSSMWNLGDAFTGCIDEVALWDRVLDENEVRRQYEAAVGAPE